MERVGWMPNVIVQKSLKYMKLVTVNKRNSGVSVLVFFEMAKRPVTNIARKSKYFTIRGLSVHFYVVILHCENLQIEFKAEKHDWYLEKSVSILIYPFNPTQPSD